MILDKNNFTASFFGYALYKKYQIEYFEFNDVLMTNREIKDNHNNRVEEELNKNINEIFRANEITEEEYNYKKENINLSQEDIYQVQKYNIKKIYHVDDITRDFIEIYHDKNKIKWYKNISSILTSED
jgi:hypothetical protein